MATLLNDPGCVAFSGANTATPGCAFFPDQIVGAILIPETKTFTNAELDTFIATCQTLCTATAATRIYPIFRFDAVTDNTEDPTIRTLGYGGKQVTKDGKYDWTFELFQGGLCHQLQLRKFNNSKAYKVLLVDAKNVVYGVRTGTDNNDLTGFTLDFIYAYPWKINTGEEAAKFMLRFAFARPEEMSDKLGYFDAGVSVEDNVKGAFDVELYSVGTGGSNIWKVGIRTVCDKVSLYDAYSATIDTNFATVFTATKGGATANPTDCAPDPLTKSWALTFAATGAHVITMGSAAALDGIAVGGGTDPGYEAVGTLTVTVV